MLSGKLRKGGLVFTILACVLLGIVLGVGYALGRTSDTYRAAVASIYEVAIDESNPLARQARGYAIGRQRGIRLAGCLMMGTLGAIMGGVFGLIVWFFHG
jgi:hypothetical protein